MSVQVTRIATKFNEIFSDKIDMSDIEATSDKYANAFQSRCLAAYALVMEAGIDFDIAAASVTDGFHDWGIDSIFKDKNSKKLYVVQAKWVNDGNGTIAQGDTLKFTNGIEKILNLDFSDFNDKILAKKNEIESAVRAMDYQIKLVVIYTSNNPCSTESTDAINKLMNRINDDCNELLLEKVLHLTEIYDCLANAAMSQDIMLDDVLLNDWGLIDEDGTPRGYYGMIGAGDVAEWWKDYENKLLAKNIRFFKGDTEVNNGISKCLHETPHKFCYYNNGIKIVAKKITRKLAHSTDRKTGLFSVEGASIVNGAQTTGSIGKAYEVDPGNVSKAKLMVQIISLENSEDEFGDKITKLSNTQNRIDNKAFAAMDPFQEKLRKDLLMDGIDYIYKDGDATIGTNTCNIDEAVVAIGCYLNDISIVALIKRAIGSVFDDITKPPYKHIFNPSVNAYLMWNTIKISKSFEKCNDEFQNQNTGLPKLISVHGNRFLLHLLYQELKSECDDFSKQYIDIPEETVNQILLKNIDLIKQAKEKLFPDAYPAHIFKNAARCKEIKEDIAK